MKKLIYKTKHLIGCIVVLLVFGVQANAQISSLVASTDMNCVDLESAISSSTGYDLTGNTNLLYRCLCWKVGGGTEGVDFNYVNGLRSTTGSRAPYQYEQFGMIPTTSSYTTTIEWLRPGTFTLIAWGGDRVSGLNGNEASIEITVSVVPKLTVPVDYHYPVADGGTIHINLNNYLTVGSPALLGQDIGSFDITILNDGGMTGLADASGVTGHELIIPGVGNPIGGGEAEIQVTPYNAAGCEGDPVVFAINQCGAAVMEVSPFSTNTNQVCDNNRITYRVTRTDAYGGDEWRFTYFNGSENKTVLVAAGATSNYMDFDQTFDRNNGATQQVYLVSLETTDGGCYFEPDPLTHPPFNVTVVSNPELTVTAGPACSNAAVEFTIDRTDVDAALSEWYFEWSIGNQNGGGTITIPVGTTSATITATGLEAGDYTLTLSNISDGNGCNIEEVTLPVTVSDPPQVTITTPVDDICRGDDMTFTVTMDGVFEAFDFGYEVSIDGAVTTTVPNATSDSQGVADIPVAAPAGTVVFTVTRAIHPVSGCDIAAPVSKTVNVIQPSIITAVPVAGVMASCPGEDLTIVVTHTNLPTDATWSFTYNDGGAPVTVDAGTTNPYNLVIPSYTVEKVYTFTSVTTESGDATCVTTTGLPAPFRVYIEPLPTVTFAPVPAVTPPLCEGTVVTFRATRTDVSTYTADWTFTYTVNGTEYTQNNINGTFIDIPITMPVAAAPDFDVTVAVTNIVNNETLCENEDDFPEPVVIRTMPLPRVTFLLEDTSICADDETILVVTRIDEGDHSDWTFTYNDGGGAIPINVTATSYSMPLTGLAFGTYTYSLISVVNNLAPACPNNAPGLADQTLTVREMPTLDIDILYEEACDREPISFDLTRTDGASTTSWSITFELDGVLTTGGPFSGAMATQTLGVLSTGQHALRIVDVTNNPGTEEECTTTIGADYTIDVYEFPEVTFARVADTVCYGNDAQFIVTRTNTGHVPDTWDVVYVVEMGGAVGPVLTDNVSGTNVHTITVPAITGNVTVTLLEIRNTFVTDPMKYCPIDLSGLPTPGIVTMQELPVIDNFVVDNDTECYLEGGNEFVFSWNRIDATYMEGRQYQITLRFTVNAGTPVEVPFLSSATAGTATYTVNVIDPSAINTVTVEVAGIRDLNLSPACEAIVFPAPITLTINPNPEVEITSANPAWICPGLGLTTPVIMNFGRLDTWVPGNIWHITYTMNDGPELTSGSFASQAAFIDLILGGRTVVKITGVYNEDTGCFTEYEAGTEPTIVIHMPTVNPVVEPYNPGAPPVFTYCAGVEIDSFDFTGEDVTAFTWTMDTDIGGGVSGVITPQVDGNGSAIGIFPGFVPQNTTNAPVDALITITPVNDDGVNPYCAGLPTTFIYRIMPNEPVVMPNDRIFCVSGTTSLFNIDGAYNRITWQNIGDDIIDGYPANTPITVDGAAPYEFPALTFTNSDPEDVKTIKIEVTTSYVNGGIEYCTSTIVWSLHVVPESIITPVDDMTYCNEEVDTQIAFNGTGLTEYTWRFIYNQGITGFPDALLPIVADAANQGIFGPNTLINAGITVLSAEIEVTPHYTFSIMDRDSNVLELTCDGTPDTFVVTVNPTPVVTNPGTQAFCIGGATAPVLDIALSGVATKYYWKVVSEENGHLNNLPALDAQQAIDLSLAPARLGPIALDLTGATDPENGQKATIEITPVYGANSAGDECLGTPEQFDVILNPTPVMSIENPVYCDGEDVEEYCFETANTDVANTTFVWERIAGHDFGMANDGTDCIPAFTAENSGLTQIMGYYNVTPTYTAFGYSCTGETKIFIVTVSPRPVIMEIEDKEYCAGQTVAPFTLTGNLPDATYKWELYSATGLSGLPDEGYNVMPGFTAVNNTTDPITATYQVSAIYQFANPLQPCAAFDTLYFDITILPKASINAIANQTACHGETVTIPITGTATAYTWSVVDGVDIGAGLYGTLPAINGGAATFTFTVNSPTPNSAIAYATFELTPIVDGVAGCEGTPITFTVTIYPKPIMMITELDRVYCNETNVPAFNFSSTYPDALYYWTKIGEGVPGVPENGIGAMPAFTAYNSGLTVKTYVYEVTPSIDGSTCVGVPQRFSIHIIPEPKVNNVPPLEYCNGDVVPAFTFDGVGKLSWKQIGGDNIGLGTTPSGTNTIPQFTASNPDAVNRVGQFEVIPTYEHMGVTCTGETRTFSIMVRPSITVLPVADMAFCSGTAVVSIPLQSNVPGAVIQWRATGADIGLPVNTGYGAIPAFTAQNHSGEARTATIEMMVQGGCSGGIETFDITVYPYATVNPINNIEVCADVSVREELTGNIVDGDKVIYRWNRVPEIGLNSEAGYVIEFTALNATEEPITATITVTAYYIYELGKECEGATRTFTVTVNPTVTATFTSDLQPYPAPLCNGEEFNYIATADKEGATFTWVRPAIDGINGGQAAQGRGNIVRERLVNSSDVKKTVTYIFTMEYNTVCSVPSEHHVTVEVMPELASEGRVPEMTSFCSDVTQIVIPVSDTDLEYTITFNNVTHAAGYDDVTTFTQLIGGAIVFEVPQGVAEPGIYGGTVTFRGEHSCISTGTPFKFQIYAPVAITGHPVSRLDLCPETFDTEKELIVSVEGGQGYVYTYTLLWSSTKEGAYTAKEIVTSTATTMTFVPGEEGWYKIGITTAIPGMSLVCPTFDLETFPAQVSFNGDILIELKWNDVAFVNNVNGEYTGYQWYKNNVAIKDATSQYYVEGGGFKGDEYKVKVFFADGESRISCNQRLTTSKAENTVKIQPNPVAQNGTLTVELDMIAEELNGAYIEIFDMVGKRIINKVVSGHETKITMDVTPGAYIVRIINASGNKVSTEKVIVR